MASEMASRRVPRGDFYDYLDFLSPDGRHRKGSAKTSADPTGNLSPLIQRRFSLLERRHRLAGWHREADTTIMFILYFSPTPFHTPSSSTITTFLSSYFLLCPFKFVFPSHSPHLCSFLTARFITWSRYRRKKSFYSAYFRFPLSPPSSSHNPVLIVLVHEIMFYLLRNDSLLTIKYYDFHFHYYCYCHRNL